MYVKHMAWLTWGRSVSWRRNPIDRIKETAKGKKSKK
jgi:hypothetical protein